MSLFFPDGLEFYPKHPSTLKTHKIQSTPSPMLEGQTTPFEAATLCKAFEDDLYGSLKIYEDKRFDVTGVVIWVGNDIHGLPTVQLSDSVDGKCCVHCIFPKVDILEQVKIGDTVVIRSNYLVMSNIYGVVMKYSELLSVEKKQ